MDGECRDTRVLCVFWTRELSNPSLFDLGFVLTTQDNIRDADGAFVNILIDLETFDNSSVTFESL